MLNRFMIAPSYSLFSPFAAHHLWDFKVELETLYKQARCEVLHDRVSTNQLQIVTLAALAIQAEEGDYTALERRAADEHLPFLKLWHLLNKTRFLSREFVDRATLVEAEVIELHRKLEGYSSVEAKNCYLDYCKQFCLTGSARFHVELTSRVTPKVPVTHFTLTVSPWGVCFCDLDTEIPVFYLSLRFTDMQSWASSQPKRGKRR